MTSSHSGTLLHINSTCNPTLCPATGTTSLGFVVCSLPEGTHATHQLLCEETGALLGEWKDADSAFREPANELSRNHKSDRVA